MTSPSHANSDILVVDDYPEIARLLEAWVEKNGHTATVVHTGEEAIDTFNPDVDIVFLDRDLHEMRGEEVLSVLREQSQTIPVAFLSAEEPDNTFVESTADDYVHKPVESETFEQAIGRLIRMTSLQPKEREYLRKKRKLDLYFNTSHRIEAETIDPLRDEIRTLEAELDIDLKNIPIDTPDLASSD